MISKKKGEGYQYAFSCTEDNNFFRFKAEAQKTTGEMTLNIVTDGKSDFSGGSVTVYKIKEDGEEECTPSESAQGVKKYNVNAENDYRIEVKPDRDAGYDFKITRNRMIIPMMKKKIFIIKHFPAPRKNYLIPSRFLLHLRK